jgi:hypothetical protein
LLNSLWRIVSGPLTLLFIPLFLSSQTQGFWYTFISLSALTIFADLGFTTIVTQFAAHEFAHLKFNKETGLFEGEEPALKQIGSLLKFVMKWSITVSAIGFPIILFIGFVMFKNKTNDVDWILPWCIYVFASGLTFTAGSTLSFFEGCGQIATIEKNRLISSLTYTACVATMLYFGFNLYSLAFTTIISAGVNVFLLFFNFRKLIYQMFNASKGFISNWRKDFLQLIWKYALSWSSGYFIFQIYTPLMFHFHGAAEAGKVGISIALVTAAFSISNVWMYVATPKLNMFASKQNWRAMDNLLLKTVTLSVLTFTLGGIFVISIMYFFPEISLLKRFLGIVPMSFLFASWILLIVIYGLATYLRAHKQEPMVLISIVSAIYIVVTTFFSIKFLDPKYLFLGFFTAQVLGLPATIMVFIKKRREWHK